MQHYRQRLFTTTNNQPPSISSHIFGLGHPSANNGPTQGLPLAVRLIVVNVHAFFLLLLFECIESKIERFLDLINFILERLGRL